MRSFTDFIAAMDDTRARSASAQRDEENTAPGATGEIVAVKMLGLNFPAILLPSEPLNEDRLSRMNRFRDLLGEREALVVAVYVAGEC